MGCVKSRAAPSEANDQMELVDNPGAPAFLVALHDYIAVQPQDLTFEKGDHLELLEKSGNWWRARLMHTGQEGFIPFNYVKRVTSLAPEEECDKGDDVKRAERQRLLPSEDQASAGASVMQDGDDPVFLVARYDYISRHPNKLTFRAGDKFQLLKRSGNWWKARLIRTGQEAYVPSNFVIIVDSLEFEEWYFKGISKRLAMRLLLSAMNQEGAYLLRDSETTKGGYTLSVREYSHRYGKVVKHFRIKTLENGEFYVSPRRTFRSVQKLISYYRGDTGRPGRYLIEPCRVLRYPRPWEKDLWEVPRNSLQLEKKLGAGKFGDIWLATYNGHTQVAVKTIKPGRMSPEAFMKEANLMKTLQHDRLVRLHAVVTQEEPIYIIMEYMEKGSLLDFLKSPEANYLSLPQLIDFSAQIAEGMCFIEQKNYIHRDLRAAKCLVSAAMACKISVFGLARVIEDKERTAPEGPDCPIRWMAPEAANRGSFTIKSDVWSFGVLMTEIISYGETPYSGMSNLDVITALEHGYNVPCPAYCSKELYGIMVACWHQNPEQRPTFEYLQGILEDFFTATGSHYHEELQPGSPGSPGSDAPDYAEMSHSRTVPSHR